MAGRANKEIAPEVLDVLRRSTIEDTILHLPGDLDAKLYQKVKFVLEIAGCKWNRSKKYHEFVKGGTADKLLAGLEEGRITDTKKLHQQFFTPASLANQIVVDQLYELIERRQDFPDELRMMDPNAGEGVFADAVRRWVVSANKVLAGRGQPLYKVRFFCVELDQALLPVLRENNHIFIHIDFLKLQPKNSSLCDFIFMNPPFTAGQDMQHVTHAFSFLKPNGKLTAIVGAMSGKREAKADKEFSELIGCFGDTLEIYPAGTFKESGTQVVTKLIELIHPDF